MLNNSLGWLRLQQKELEQSLAVLAEYSQAIKRKMLW